MSTRFELTKSSPVTIFDYSTTDSNMSQSYSKRSTFSSGKSSNKSRSNLKTTGSYASSLRAKFGYTQDDDAMPSNYTSPFERRSQPSSRSIERVEFSTPRERSSHRTYHSNTPVEMMYHSNDSNDSHLSPPPSRSSGSRRHHNVAHSDVTQRSRYDRESVQHRSTFPTTKRGSSFYHQLGKSHGKLPPIEDTQSSSSDQSNSDDSYSDTSTIKDVPDINVQSSRRIALPAVPKKKEYVPRSQKGSDTKLPRKPTSVRNPSPELKTFVKRSESERRKTGLRNELQSSSSSETDSSDASANENMACTPRDYELSIRDEPAVTFNDSLAVGKYQGKRSSFNGVSQQRYQSFGYTDNELLNDQYNVIRWQIVSWHLAIITGRDRQVDEWRQYIVQDTNGVLAIPGTPVLIYMHENELTDTAFYLEKRNGKVTYYYDQERTSCFAQYQLLKLTPNKPINIRPNDLTPVTYVTPTLYLNTSTYFHMGSLNALILPNFEPLFAQANQGPMFMWAMQSDHFENQRVALRKPIMVNRFAINTQNLMVTRSLKRTIRADFQERSLADRQALVYDYMTDGHSDSTHLQDYQIFSTEVTALTTTRMMCESATSMMLATVSAMQPVIANVTQRAVNACYAEEPLTKSAAQTQQILKRYDGHHHESSLTFMQLAKLLKARTVISPNLLQALAKYVPREGSEIVTLMGAAKRTNMVDPVYNHTLNLLNLSEYLTRESVMLCMLSPNGPPQLVFPQNAVKSRLTWRIIMQTDLGWAAPSSCHACEWTTTTILSTILFPLKFEHGGTPSYTIASALSHNCWHVMQPPVYVPEDYSPLVDLEAKPLNIIALTNRVMLCQESYDQFDLANSAVILNSMRDLHQLDPNSHTYYSAATDMPTMLTTQYITTLECCAFQWIRERKWNREYNDNKVTSVPNELDPATEAIEAMNEATLSSSEEQEDAKPSTSVKETKIGTPVSDMQTHIAQLIDRKHFGRDEYIRIIHDDYPNIEPMCATKSYVDAIGSPVRRSKSKLYSQLMQAFKRPNVSNRQEIKDAVQDAAYSFDKFIALLTNVYRRPIAIIKQKHKKRNYLPVEIYCPKHATDTSAVLLLDITTKAPGKDKDTLYLTLIC